MCGIRKIEGLEAIHTWKDFMHLEFPLAYKNLKEQEFRNEIVIFVSVARSEERRVGKECVP